MHYYQFNIGDYITHTAHLDESEDLAYRRMLDWYYLHESPLPDSVEQIAKYIRMRTHTESIANVLSEFFIAGEYGYHQKKADEQIDAYKAKSDKAKASASARWSKKPIERDASALQTQSEGNANHKPLTINHKPINKPLDQSAIDRELMFEEFWLSGIRKVGKKAAKSRYIKILKNLKGVSDQDFNARLITDVKKRLSMNQLGFAEMHPTTYLNGERWNDDLIKTELKANAYSQPAIGFIEKHTNNDWAQDL